MHEEDFMKRNTKIILTLLLFTFSFIAGMLFQYSRNHIVLWIFHREKSAIEATSSNLALIRKTINEYYDIKGKYPTDMNELLDSKLGLSINLYSVRDNGKHIGYELYMPENSLESPPFIYETKPFHYEGQLQFVNLSNGVTVLIKPSDLPMIFCNKPTN